MYTLARASADFSFLTLSSAHDPHYAAQEYCRQWTVISNTLRPLLAHSCQDTLSGAASWISKVNKVMARDVIKMVHFSPPTFNAARITIIIIHIVS